MGICYDEGRGVQQDREKAVEWYRKAANQGDAAAQLNLGLSYYNGEGVEKNLNKALEWFEKAAKQGDKDALRAYKELLQEMGK